MKSKLLYLNAKTGKESECGKVLNISLSSRNLDWSGIFLEEGSSPFFRPKDIVTPYFYFALGKDDTLRWDLGRERELTTYYDEIWFNPPYTSFTHNINEPCNFIILAIDQNRMFDALGKKIDRYKVELLNNYNITDPMLKNLVEMFYMEVSGGGKNGSTFVENILKTLADYFFRNYSNLEDLENNKIAKSSLSQDDIDLIDAFFKKNLGEPILQEQAASVVNMSLFHFLREFKKSKGITPHQYLLKLRIDESKILLEDSNNSIQRIAYDLGFSDQSHFSRTFKKLTGVTPKQYRT